MFKPAIPITLMSNRHQTDYSWETSLNIVKIRIPTASPIDPGPISILMVPSWERLPISQGKVSFNAL